MAVKTWLTLLACFIFAQSWAQADEIYTTVFNVFESKKTDSLLVLSGVDGRVYKTAKNDKNKKVIKSLVGQVVKLSFSQSDKGAIITGIQPANPNQVDTRTMDLNHFQYNQLRQFAPTDLQNIEKVREVFKNMLNDGDKTASQCFKRAHMWAYDMWSKLGINSEKVFIFYTTRYILIEEFEWWFHVAPVVHAAGEDFVMDGTFMNRPITLKQWKDYFIKSERLSCPMVEKYQDYEDHQYSHLCYLMKVPMYFFRPLDIENRDKKGEERNHWILEELQDARNAFKNWDETYEGLDTGKETIKH